MTLDFMPSPSREDPGLFIRDPYRFSDAMLIVPPPLVETLECFDGRHSDLDLRAALARITGRLETEDIARHLIDTLANAGFLEDEIFARMQRDKKREFAEKPLREPSHAGSAYPEDPKELRRTMTEYMADGASARADGSTGDGSTGDGSTQDGSSQAGAWPRPGWLDPGWLLPGWRHRGSLRK